MTESEWKIFRSEASIRLRAALEPSQPLEPLMQFFENYTALTNPKLCEFFMWCVSEIDGNRNIYLEVLHLLETDKSEADLMRYIES